MNPFRIEQLEKQHDRSGFDCGTEVLNDYLKTRARKDQERHFSTCYLAIANDDTNAIAGFYTISSSSIKLDQLSPATRKKLPRYDDVPVVRIGRLAVDHAFRGRGLGSALIHDAIKRVVQSGIGVYAVVVDAKDDTTIAFYKHMEFEVLEDKDDVLYLPIASTSV